MAEARVAVFRRKNYGVSFACDRCRNIFYFGRTREVSFSRVLANGRAKVLEYEITMSVGRLSKIEIQNRYTRSPPPHTHLTLSPSLRCSDPKRLFEKSYARCGGRHPEIAGSNMFAFRSFSTVVRVLPFRFNLNRRRPAKLLNCWADKCDDSRLLTRFGQVPEPLDC